MKTIDDILNEQEFTAEEKKVFLTIIRDAKILQKNLMLEELNKRMSAEINKLFRP